MVTTEEKHDGRKDEIEVTWEDIERNGFVRIPFLRGDQFNNIKKNVDAVVEEAGQDDPENWYTRSKMLSVYDGSVRYANFEGTQIQTKNKTLQDLRYSVCSKVAPLVGKDVKVSGGGKLAIRYSRPSLAPWTTPIFGWHIERGAGDGLRATTLACLTKVDKGGGGLTVIPGSHRWSWIHQIMSLKLPYFFSVLIAHIVAWICMPWAVEVTADEGELIIMDPYLVHSSSVNVSRRPRLVLQYKAGTCGVGLPS